ncbi:MAG: type I secretion system permease/ATPase, partial [Campylobacterales bacterium]
MNLKDSIPSEEDSLLKALVLYTKLYHRPFSPEALLYGLPLNDKEGGAKLFSMDPKSKKALFSRVAARAGLKSTLIRRNIADILELHLPMILLLSNGNSCILETFSEDKTKAKIIFPDGDGSEEWVSVEDLEKEYLGYGFLLKKKFKYDITNSNNLKINVDHWFWDTLKLSRSIYRDVIWASLLINIFVLATPLFTMNVYDRVIPNNAEETLIVFTIGIVFVYLLDFFLKFTRSYMLELAGKKSDIIMSSIIYEKVMNLKL